MPDGYVQGFFKAAQSLLQALTPTSGSVGEIAAAAGRVGLRGWQECRRIPGRGDLRERPGQLIQYAPLTDQVANRPLVILPPCINKFCILDPQPENSFVRFTAEQGPTSTTRPMISWPGTIG
jgi:poly(3-hydroxyalkanoate) synthetase